MGLKFSEDLAAWHRWAEKQNRLRWLKNKMSHQGVAEAVAFILFSRSPAKPRVLVALESTSPTQVASLLAPAERLIDMGVPVGVIAPQECTSLLHARGYKARDLFSSKDHAPDSLGKVQEVIAVGNYLQVGEWAYKNSLHQGWGFNVIQHGLNTPFAPPLPHRSTLFAFSEADAKFWKSGRADIDFYVTGSQIFYEAYQNPASDWQGCKKAPIFLGQMHGAELSRFSFANASFKFCLNHSAIYRPHPSEKDRLSTIIQQLWVKRGIKIDRSSIPLKELNSPVVSVFSTGVLEAAIRGVPAWVYHPRPPQWLKEFWDRYGMNQWGSEPTPAPAQPDTEPAERIAHIIAQKLEK